MQIFIKTQNGKTLYLEVEQSENIANIKRKIEEKEGIPFECQRLSYGKVLKDDQTLLYYNIKDESNLQLTLALKSSMQIIIKSSYKKYILYFSPNTTIKQVKDKLKLLEKNCSFSPRLIFRGIELEDDKSLSESKLENGSIILLIDKEYYEYMLIFIKSFSGLEITIYIKSNDTIKDIKNEISKIFKIPTYSQTLFFNGKTLYDNKSLSYYNIKKNSIIFLNIHSYLGGFI